MKNEATAIARVLSRELSVWGYHVESIGNDVEVTIEFEDANGTKTRQRIRVYADIDLEQQLPDNPKNTFHILTQDLMDQLDGKSSAVVAAVIAANNAELSGAVPPITGTAPYF